VAVIWRRCWKTVRPLVNVSGGSSWTIRKGSPAVCQSSVFCQKGWAIVDMVGDEDWSLEVALSRLYGEPAPLEILRQT